MVEELTADSLLGGRVRFRQPADGYRVALDPVLLAAAVAAAPGQRVLDAGAGTGAASLCLAARVPGCAIVGLELQRELQRIASRNVAENGLAGRVETIHGDLGRPPPRLSAESFDHVMTNPPYLARDATTPSPNPARTLANVEGDLDLAGWLAACVRMLKSGGCLTLVHRAQRLGDVLAALHGRLGGVVVFPLWPGRDRRPAKRILVQGCKGSGAPLQLMPGLVMHDDDGRLTPTLDGVLRHGQRLDLKGGEVQGDD